MGNVANPKQVKEGAKKEKWRLRQEKEDMLFLLKQPQFRRYVWRLLETCNIFASIWRCSAEIHRLAGRQELGQEILVEVTQADPESFIQMMKENQDKPEETKNDN